MMHLVMRGAEEFEAPETEKLQVEIKTKRFKRDFIPLLIDLQIA